MTGATGFIGRFLMARLLRREGTIYVLSRPGSLDKSDELRERLGADEQRVVAIRGDLGEPLLGVSAADVQRLDGTIEHFFHLAAIYDITADADTQRAANVQGTEHALDLAAALHARHFHLISSIAAAGLYPGTWTEEMFDEAVDIEHNPYYETKHVSEGLVRAQREVPWRIYRPGVVVGDSRTGEIDKIDGPYYLFRAIQRLRDTLPSWVRGIGLDGGEINIVPVDHVADALDYLAHAPDRDYETFHLTDPAAHSVGDLIKIFAKAAHAPAAALKVDVRAFDGLPWKLATTLTSLPGARQAPTCALDGNTVMITGASSGIGRATALEVLTEHGRVDILINNAGRSIRRSVALSYERFHDYERTMQLNYFGAVRLILALLPVMRQTAPDGRRGGQIINVSSIGVQTNPPRISAYVASKAALDAFSRCVAFAHILRGVHW